MHSCTIVICFLLRYQQKERWAIVFIQRKVREMIKRRQEKKRRIEEKARKEIKLQEKDLEKKYGKKKAKEMSEKKLLEVIARLEKEDEDNNRKIRDQKKM